MSWLDRVRQLPMRWSETFVNEFLSSVPKSDPVQFVKEGMTTPNTQIVSVCLLQLFYFHKISSFPCFTSYLKNGGEHFKIDQP